MNYNWQKKDWPHFVLEESEFSQELVAFQQAHATVLPAYQSVVGSSLESEGLVLEALRTSSVEGEKVDESVILSSVCRVMGVKAPPIGFTHDQRSEGAAALVMDVRRDWHKPLNRDLLLFWHRDLMQGAVHAGQFRVHADPMQVVRQNAFGEYEVRFEAPPSAQIETEVAQFLTEVASWSFGTTPLSREAIKAALIHLYFESIHPFEDGNGRLGRALVAKILAESLGAGVVVPISPVIEAHRAAYYDELHAASFTLDATRWVKFLIPLFTQAMVQFVENVHFILRKRDYLTRWEEQLTERQMKVLKRLFKDGADGVARGLSAAKYQRMTGVSKPTATRDLAEMMHCGALVLTGAGRAAHYQLVFETPEM